MITPKEMRVLALGISLITVALLCGTALGLFG